MEHAYEKMDPKVHVEKDVQIILDLSPERLTVIIRDRGMAFDPRRAPDVNVR